ncbi:MAG: YciI-like protein [Mycobacteriales bacterium]
MAYYALEYQLVDDYVVRRTPLRPEHLGLAQAAAERGELVLAGALMEPTDRALLVWSTEDRAPIEAFVEADPYVREGLVTSWTIRPWTVVAGSAAAS